MLTTLRRFVFAVTLAWLAACGGPVARVDLSGKEQPAQAANAPQVLLVTLRGKIGTKELARCHRTLRVAESSSASSMRVVFRLADAGSQGEDPSDIQALLDHVQQSKADSIAVLSGQVTHGAAALALVCKRVYCLPKAEWGAVEKPEQEWTESDEALAQRFDAAREAMAARLQARDPKLTPAATKLALAMVDPRKVMVIASVRQGGVERAQVLEQAELAALSAGGAKVIGDQVLPRPLMISAQQAEDFGLSNGTLQQLEEIADAMHFDRSAVGELTENWAESMVGWLELLRPFLLIAGFVLLVIEIKTGGIVLPGLLGVAFLALAFFYSYLVGLADITEILLFFLGLAAIGVEIFLLPGTVVFGAVGFVCLILALVLSQQTFVLPSNAIEEGILLRNLLNLVLLIVAVLVSGALTWRLLPKVPWFNRVLLPTPKEASVVAPALGAGASGQGLVDAALMALVGRVGAAATTLRPTGAMEIDGERIDVVTEGEFVEAGTAVRVLYVQGTRVVVAREGSAGRRGERGAVGLVVLLCLVGLGLLVAEVVFVSFGIIATISGISLLSAIFVAFQDSIAFGVTMVVVEGVAAPIVLTMSFKLLPKTPFGKALILDGPAKPAVGAVEAELLLLVGRTGVALSPLRPAGFARIDGKRVDVVTRGEMLDPDCTVVVVAVQGNRVVVARQ